MSMTNDNYLERFFEEKEIPFAVWEISHNEELHIIDNEEVIKMIKEAPDQEKKGIVSNLRKIDFMNGNINHFLHFLAKSYVKVNF